MCEGKGLNYPEEQLVADVELLDVSDTMERQLRTSVHNMLIRSKSYPEMTYRYEDVIEAHPKTLNGHFMIRLRSNTHGVTFQNGLNGAKAYIDRKSVV